MRLKRKTEGVAGGGHYYSDRYPGSRILPITEKREGMNPDLYLQLPNTFYLIGGNDEFLQMFTVMPDGVHVAWAVCQSCSKWVPHCKCSNGFSVTRGVEYIYDQTRAELAGETWGPSHTCYLGSLREKRKTVWRLTRGNSNEAEVPKTRTPKRVQPTPMGAVQKKLRLKKEDSASADADVNRLVKEKLGHGRKLRRKK